jgi:acetoin utilization deacetylase AcuC-like enzyme
MAGQRWQWDYVSSLLTKCLALQGGEIGALDIDTSICAESFAAAAIAAGAACRAVDRVAVSPHGPRRVFVAVRPPGHHAGPRGRVVGPEGEASSSQGFCLLNSVAIAAAYARYNYRGLLNKVAIVDFDVHYGDGTAACVLNLVPGTHQTDAGHGLRISMPSYKPWLDETDPDKVTSLAPRADGCGLVHLKTARLTAC